MADKERPHLPRLSEEFKVCATAYVLGIGTGAGFLMAWYTSTLWGWGLYMTSLTFFHATEFMLTAYYNREVLSYQSFLLTNGDEYKYAALGSWIEFWVEYLFFPSLKGSSLVILLGFATVLVGHYFRVMALVHCKKNFKHIIAETKAPDHQLVTDGVYSICRHPSYFGFYWWSVGTQLLLCNPFCVVGYAYFSWRFFAERIPYEERLLLEFFGDEFRKFKARVPTRIPFIA